jgi:hypothetical protein
MHIYLIYSLDFRLKYLYIHLPRASSNLNLKNI